MTTQTTTTTPITASDPIDILPDSLEMPLIPAVQDNGLSPFANLEEQRIINACKRDRAFQDSVSRLHYCAHVIIHHYYAGKFTLEEAIALLGMYCKRSRMTAIVNIQNSAYAQYTAEQLKHIF